MTLSHLPLPVCLSTDAMPDAVADPSNVIRSSPAPRETRLPAVQFHGEPHGAK